jgi:hypothetical protein
MKNYLKMTLLLGILFLSILSISSVNAQSYTYSPASNAYTYVSNTISYSEDIQGENRGFSLRQSSSVQRNEVIKGCDYYDWTSNYRKCRKTSERNRYSYDDYNYNIYDRYHYDNFRANYDQDKALKEAFKTYQQSSKQQYQLESQRIKTRNNRKYSYGGYGSGYTRYSWGW